MIFDKDVFLTKLNALFKDQNNSKVEMFLYDQLATLQSLFSMDQSIDSCGCGYGSIQGDSRFSSNDDVKRQEERTSGIVFVLNELACFYRDTGKLNKSIEMFQKAELEMHGTSIIKTLNYVKVIINKAGTYRIMGEYEKALVEFNKAERVLNKIGSKDYHFLASLYKDIALVYHDLKDFDKETEFLEKAKAI